MAPTKPVNMEIGSCNVAQLDTPKIANVKPGTMSREEIPNDRQTCNKRKANLSTANDYPPISKKPKLNTQVLSIPSDLYLSSSELMLRARNLKIVANETSNDMMQIVYFVRSALYILLAGVEQDDGNTNFSMFEKSLNILK